ncbi:MAG: 4-alpha-glucanotransferase [Thermomicrobiales bacterium]
MLLSSVGYGATRHTLGWRLSNPLLISIDGLAFLDWRRADSRGFNEHEVDYGAAGAYKARGAADGIRVVQGTGIFPNCAQLSAFEIAQASWLVRFCVFHGALETLPRGFQQDWPDEIRLRDPKALAALRLRWSTKSTFTRSSSSFDPVERACRYANERGIQIVGDIPIYVALDSADVWAN